MSRPNVLLICVDHWPGRLLGSAGHPAIHTPTLDQIAANGTRFDSAYSECPVCCPARRTLMTGLRPHSHGMLQNQNLSMPEAPTLAGTFREAGYQTYAVGKLHVTPQRNRIGFDDVILDEESRGREGVIQDDYEVWLGEQGYPGQRFAHGLCNNEYVVHPYPLEERLHVTNWAASQMARQIHRKDPTRPAFWYLSFSHPHPPLEPLRDEFEAYRDVAVPEPISADWNQDGPLGYRHRTADVPEWRTKRVTEIRKAFYALCTQIDRQIRVVLGALNDTGQARDTVVMFVSDHGDMLGDHGMWAKSVPYELSANVPFLVSGPGVDHGQVVSKPVGLADVMPTLLGLAGIDVPSSCDGTSVFDDGDDSVYVVFGEDAGASRAIRRGSRKLVYWPAGNALQTFDLAADPEERKPLASNDAALVEELISRLTGSGSTETERSWVRGGQLVGMDAPEPEAWPNYGFSGQRGTHWPPPKPYGS